MDFPKCLWLGVSKAYRRSRFVSNVNLQLKWQHQAKVIITETEGDSCDTEPTVEEIAAVHVGRKSACS